MHTQSYVQLAPMVGWSENYLQIMCSVQQNLSDRKLDCVFMIHSSPNWTMETPCCEMSQVIHCNGVSGDPSGQWRLPVVK